MVTCPECECTKIDVDKIVKVGKYCPEEARYASEEETILLLRCERCKYSWEI